LAAASESLRLLYKEMNPEAPIRVCFFCLCPEEDLETWSWCGGGATAVAATTVAASVAAAFAFALKTTTLTAGEEDNNGLQTTACEKKQSAINHAHLPSPPGFCSSFFCFFFFFL
jgi:hypothetical protein